MSDYPIQIEKHSALEFDSVIQLAPLEGREQDVLAYTEPYRAHLPHFIVSAAYKILRFYKAEPEERYWIGSSVSGRLPAEDHRDLQERLPSMSAEHLEATSSLLRSSLTRQLVSFPVDLRVESDILRTLAEHRARQTAYLRRQVQDFAPTLIPGMADVFPRRVYQACRLR